MSVARVRTCAHPGSNAFIHVGDAPALWGRIEHRLVNVPRRVLRRPPDDYLASDLAPLDLRAGRQSEPPSNARPHRHPPLGGDLRFDSFHSLLLSDAGPVDCRFGGRANAMDGQGPLTAPGRRTSLAERRGGTRIRLAVSGKGRHVFGVTARGQWSRQSFIHAERSARGRALAVIRRRRAGLLADIIAPYEKEKARAERVAWNDIALEATASQPLRSTQLSPCIATWRRPLQAPTTTCSALWSR